MLRENRREILAIVLALALSSSAPNGFSAMACWTYVQYYSVCTEDPDGTTTCWNHQEYVTQCMYVPGNNGDTMTDGGEVTTNRYDANMNGIVDNWRSIVKTSDPCANNFNRNERLSTEFGGPNDLRRHSGVDVSADSGNPVFSFKDGRVSQVGFSDQSCGFRVQVKHDDGSAATYCHMKEETLVSVGQTVLAGYTRIGSVGMTGQTSGPHLHVSYSTDGSFSEESMREYFEETDKPPYASMLNPEGC